jgi:hypothetical protein
MRRINALAIVSVFVMLVLWAGVSVAQQVRARIPIVLFESATCEIPPKFRVKRRVGFSPIDAFLIWAQRTRLVASV